MKHKIVLVLLLAFFSFKTLKTSAQAINVQDSLTLVDFYDSTGGPNWINHTNWLTAAPVSTWYGVNVDTSGRVSYLLLDNNKLVGKIPSSISNMTALFFVSFTSNQLSGSIPASMAALTKFDGLYLDHNQLSGDIPAFSPQQHVFIGISYNQFNFTPIEKAVSLGTFIGYFPQDDIPLYRNGNVLSVSAGGTLSKNTYSWYNGTTLVATKTGDSTLTITSEGDYNVAVTNTIASQLTLYSIDTVNKQDSLILVSFYNTNGGNTWINKTNWLSESPIDTWFGVTVRARRVVSLQLPSNNVLNTIPDNFSNLSALAILDLSSNQLTGAIPITLGNLPAMSSINLGGNQLTGTIPSSLGNLSVNLKTIILGGNLLTGTIPIGIGNLTGLTTLNLSVNQLTGTIPASFGNLTKLQGLYMANNQLTDSIPSIIGNLNSLYELHLENNQLSGTIPSSLGRDIALMQLYLSNNRLTGNIPDSLTLLVQLGRLVLSNNQLSGNIPDSIIKMPELFDLEVDNNKLSGTVPSLTMNIINDLNLSHNEFTFNGMENLPNPHGLFLYAPQANIPITKNENLLSVSAGGTLGSDTFYLYKNGVLTATQIGDSVFAVTNTGKYSISVKNAHAIALTLYSDTTTVGIILADSTTLVTKAITGTSTIDINNGIFKLVSLAPTAGANALNGNVNTIVAFDTTVETFRRLPYVQRHYDITPATNPTTAQATVTLYFTQQDFDNFNTYVNANNAGIPLLPTGGVNNGNVRIIQLHGSFTTSPDPGNYNNSTTVFITPSVTWDATDNWWVVTFPVNGFSGFFVSTANFTLPLTLLEFKGKLQNDVVALEWLTSSEISTKDFTIERSNDGHSFNAIGKVSATSTPGDHGYTFTDASPLTGTNFYRLLMTDIDGRSSFSNIIPIQVNASLVKVSVYPNPTNNLSVLEFSNTVAGKYFISITDQSGRLMKKLSGVSNAGINKISIDMHRFAKGTYFITLSGEGINTHSLKVGKE